MIPATKLALGKTRFTATYLIRANAERTAYQRAEELCVEQTIEFPLKYIANDDIRAHVVGQIVSCEALDAQVSRIVVSHAQEVAGGTFTQLLNVLFGNVSIQPGVKLQRFDLPSSMLDRYKGPRFGIEGLRQLAGEPHFPLLCTALKPMGLGTEALADQAYRFAMAGVHLIKDDHGLADQPFAPFRDRVAACADAILRANTQSGHNCIYLPSLSGPSERIVEDAYYAKSVGAGGLLIAPGLVGWDVLRRFAEDDALGLPIMSHPSLIGSFTASPDSGLSHAALYGQLVRLAGADATIYPNFGGRFSFSFDECKSIQCVAQESMGHLRPIFATPGGGMNFHNVPEMLDAYGKDVIFLIGGAMHQGDGDIIANARRLHDLVRRA